MHRRPSLTQRDGLFRTTRFVLYGNRVRVIRVTPLVRDDQYIPLQAVDPDERITRQPDVRDLLLAATLVLPGGLGAAGWPMALPTAAAVGCGLLAAVGLVLLVTRGGPVRTYVEHGALQLRADVPDADAVRHFVARVVTASREVLAGEQEEVLPASVAGEIRRLHGHLAQGRLTREGFDRHKTRLIRSIREYVA
ncbi:MAG TPA: hypothetical protein VFY71_03820 [Planctomycetota bacterium]|nr:hypothetical protein [Planctomycetota bacterium]